MASLQSCASQAQLDHGKNKDLIQPNGIQSLNPNKSAILKQNSIVKGQVGQSMLLRGQGASAIKKLKIKATSRTN